MEQESKQWDQQLNDFKISIETANSLFENIRFLEKNGYLSNHDMEENTYIKDDTLKRIAHSQGLQNIEYLNLKKQDISQYGMQHFLQSQFITNTLKNLESLQKFQILEKSNKQNIQNIYSYIIMSINLSNTKINGEVLKQIYGSKIQHLKILKLKNCNQIVFDDLQIFLKNYKAAYLQQFCISSNQVSTKKLVTELKNLESLTQTQIVFNDQEKQIDISNILTTILTWVAILIKQQKLQKFTMDLRDCKGINNGFNLFLEEIKSLNGIKTCPLIFKISKSSLSIDVIKQLEQNYQLIQFFQ